MCLPTDKTSRSWLSYFHHGDTTKGITNCNCSFFTGVKKKWKRGVSRFDRVVTCLAAWLITWDFYSSPERDIFLVRLPSMPHQLFPVRGVSIFLPTLSRMMFCICETWKLLLRTYGLLDCDECHIPTGTSQAKDRFSAIALPTHCNQSPIRHVTFPTVSQQASLPSSPFHIQDSIWKLLCFQLQNWFQPETGIRYNTTNVNRASETSILYYWEFCCIHSKMLSVPCLRPPSSNW